MVQVASEAILQIEYDAAAQILFVRFTDGGLVRLFRRAARRASGIR